MAETQASPKTEQTVPVVVWYDYIWPWCYIGLERVDRLIAEYPVAVELRPFLLRPDAPPEGTPRPSGGGELQEPLRSYAQAAGLERMRRPALSAYSHLALEASEYAREQGHLDEFHRATYRAYWEEGQNIGDLSVLQRLAQETGLNWEELRPRLEQRHYREQVAAQYQQALGLGIHGIPAFLIGGRFLFTGAQPYEMFRQVMRRVQEEGWRE